MSCTGVDRIVIALENAGWMRLEDGLFEMGIVHKTRGNWVDAVEMELDLLAMQRRPIMDHILKLHQEGSQ